jgi:hypothetical protein
MGEWVDGWERGDGWVIDEWRIGGWVREEERVDRWERGGGWMDG